MGGEKEYRERATRTRPRRLFRRVGSIAASNLSFSAKTKRHLRVSFLFYLRSRSLNSFSAGYPARASEQKRLSIVFAKRRSQSASEQSRASAGDSSRHATRVVGEADSNLSFSAKTKKTPSGVFFVLSPKSSEALGAGKLCAGRRGRRPLRV